jgi:hypothetical protein
MAMTLFNILNGLGVVFLVYVLVQFWKEGHRPMEPATSDRVIEFSVKERPTVVIVTRPISGGLQVADAPSASAEALQHSARRRKPALWRRRVEPTPVSHSARPDISMVSGQARMSGPRETQVLRVSEDGVDEAPLKRHSSR